MQYLQTVAQLSGASGQFSSSSTAADYVHWAQSVGINPSGGWQPGANLNKAALAQTLVQVLNLNPNKFGGDYARILVREGIDISHVGDQVSKDDLTAVIDQSAGQFVQVITAKKSTQTAPSSPTKATSGSPHKITICHKGHVTITVDDAALDAHLAHGDTIGACRTSE